VFNDCKEYDLDFHVCQRVGKPSHHDAFPLHFLCTLQVFEKLATDFIGPINPTARHSKA
jgi:hypothetical protein